MKKLIGKEHMLGGRGTTVLRAAVLGSSRLQTLIPKILAPKILALRLLALGLPTLGLLSLGLGWATGVGMSNTWIDMPLSRARCIRQATLAVKRAGFTSNFEVTGESLFADQKDYSVLFRCVADKQMAYIVVAGPDSNLADQYVSDVEGGFSGK